MTMKYWVVNFGSKKVYAKLRHKCYWNNMTRDITKYTKDCKECKLNKVKPPNIEKLTITETPVSAFDIVVIDSIGPMKRSISDNTYTVRMMCDLNGDQCNAHFVGSISNFAILILQMMKESCEEFLKSDYNDIFPALQGSTREQSFEIRKLMWKDIGFLQTVRKIYPVIADRIRTFKVIILLK